MHARSARNMSKSHQCVFAALNGVWWTLTNAASTSMSAVLLVVVASAASGSDASLGFCGQKCINGMHGCT